MVRTETTNVCLWGAGRGKGADIQPFLFRPAFYKTGEVGLGLRACPNNNVGILDLFEVGGAQAKVVRRHAWGQKHAQVLAGHDRRRHQGQRMHAGQHLRLLGKALGLAQAEVQKQ